ncbi:sugar ABC transporter substrate-binding protein [Enterococcus sp. 669A]|uniref:Sugar ABC transporter substrate-binding protein n=1 Tax=Candidatus Enterococcus moelleringii TaxID=2815325 RepID=A0ABS3L7L7_9ENTE|nr:sugar ABC transporter substrate-binding protein [Enterococcus sp. 669A]MBO1304741.1 sugar ABC transporter substrate-binding protein [Enterococcus sp. 669A]
MNKKLLVGITGILAVGVLGACGGGSTTNDSGGEAQNGDQVTISYGLWDKQQAPVFEEIAADFEKENPDIKVEFQVTPWAQYWTKLETAVTGENAPDVFWMNIPRAIDYIDNGVLEPLDDIEFDKDKIPSQYQESYTQEGNLYGIPKDYDTNALWYNKKMFDEAGIDYPDESWDWAKLQEVAKQLTKEDEGVYGLATPPQWETGYYQTIYQNDGRPFSEDGKKSGFTDKATIEGVQYWYDFVENGGGTPVEVTGNTNATDLLISGKVAMIIDGSYQAPVVFEDEYGSANVDVAPLPKGKERATTSNSLANVVYAGSKNKDAAKKWVEFLSKEEQMKHVAESGTVIPSYEGTADAWVQAYPEKNLQVFVDAVDYAIPFSNYKNSSAATAAEQDIMNEVWAGNKTVEEGCKEIAEKADEILARK